MKVTQTSYIFDSHIKEYKTENLMLVPLSKYTFICIYIYVYMWMSLKQKVLSVIFSVVMGC